MRQRVYTISTRKLQSLFQNTPSSPTLFKPKLTPKSDEHDPLKSYKERTDRVRWEPEVL